jgi:hypothetical protein
VSKGPFTSAVCSFDFVDTCRDKVIQCGEGEKSVIERRKERERESERNWRMK